MNGALAINGSSFAASVGASRFAGRRRCLGAAARSMGKARLAGVGTAPEVSLTWVAQPLAPAVLRPSRRVACASRRDRDDIGDVNRLIIVPALWAGLLNVALNVVFLGSPAPHRVDDAASLGAYGGRAVAPSVCSRSRAGPRGGDTPSLVCLRLLQAGDVRLRESENEGMWELQHLFLSSHWHTLELSRSGLEDAASVLQAAIDEGESMWMFKRGELSLRREDRQKGDIWLLHLERAYPLIMFTPAELHDALRLLRTALDTFKP